MSEHTAPTERSVSAAPPFTWAADAPKESEPPGLQPVTATVSGQAGIALHAALMAGLDGLAHGVALLDVDGRVRFANLSARALFKRLGWHGSTADAPLRLPTGWPAALQNVCVRSRREFMRVTTPDRSVTTIVLIPLSLPGANLAFTVFGRDEICGSVELQMFALRHKLTHAETQVLRQLCRGLQAADIARENSVARTTVLTQIASIRSKTASASIRVLLDSLSRMPQMVPSLPVPMAW